MRDRRLQTATAGAIMGRASAGRLSAIVFGKGWAERSSFDHWMPVMFSIPPVAYAALSVVVLVRAAGSAEADPQRPEAIDEEPRSNPPLQPTSGADRKG